eukprot:763068-Hanusia_phi.AAC.7
MIARYKVFKRDDVLFRQQDEPDAAYILLSGKCNLIRTHAEGDASLFSVAVEMETVGDSLHLDDKCLRSVRAVIQSETAECIYFQRTELDELIIQWNLDEEKKKFEFLKSKISLLQCISHESLKKILICFEKFEYKQGSIVYKQQDEAKRLFFVWEGELDIVKRLNLVKYGPSSSPVESFSEILSPSVVRSNAQNTILEQACKYVQIGKVKAGEYFGEVEIFNDITRTCTVIASANCKLLGITKQNLIEMIPLSVQENIFRYSTTRQYWRSMRIMKIIEGLTCINWSLERDKSTVLEPELKAPAKLRAILPLTKNIMMNNPWLGVHTSLSEDEASRWSLFNHGKWCRTFERNERKNSDERNPQNVNEISISDKSPEKQKEHARKESVIYSFFSPSSHIFTLQ